MIRLPTMLITPAQWGVLAEISECFALNWQFPLIRAPRRTHSAQPDSIEVHYIVDGQLARSLIEPDGEIHYLEEYGWIQTQALSVPNQIRSRFSMLPQMSSSDLEAEND